MCSGLFYIARLTRNAVSRTSSTSKGSHCFLEQKNFMLVA